MPKGAKIDDDIGGNRVLDDETSDKMNGPGINGKKLMKFIKRYENVQSEIDDIMSNAQEACTPHREDQAEIVKEAAEAGFSKKEFKTILRKRRLEQKLEQVADSLDADQRETYEQFLHALGALDGTPLGQAAAGKHPEAAGAALN
ncbi:hypothetical protein [Taklimakanibacter deserti]|uniref:hypothetical protein n=1 Tax=Taklimakanibacter deserti TaxID=2267839 RepID=UPI000E64A03F